MCLRLDGSSPATFKLTIMRKPIVIVKNAITGCHEVTSHKPDNYGYPFITIKRKGVYLHREAYKTHKGEIPPGMVVRHTCDNPGCVNPEHLILGTHADNVADKVAKGRQAAGETHGRAKLTTEQVKAIFADTRTAADLAKLYKVSDSHICDIKNKKRWVAVTKAL